MTRFFSQLQAAKIGFGVQLVLLAVLAIGFCAGCKRSAAENAKNAVSQSREGEEIEFKDETGGEVHYAGGKAPVTLPSGFPTDVPLYPKAIPIQTRTKTPSVCVLLNTPDAAARVKAFYLEKMKENGWKLETDTATADAVMLVGVKKDRKLIVLISEESGGAQFSLTIVQEK